MKKAASVLMIAVILLTLLFPFSAEGVRTAAAASIGETIIDNGNPGYSETPPGNWQTSTLAGYNNSSTRYTSIADSYAQWTPNLTSGTYRVSIYKIVHSLSDPNAKIEIRHGGVTDTKYVNNREGISGWVDLGNYEFADGPGQYVRMILNTLGTNGRADAVRFQKLSAIATLASPSTPDYVPVNTDVSIAFDKPMDRSTLTPQNIVLKETVTGTAVQGEFQVSADNRTYTVRPAANLKNNTSYTVYAGENVLTGEGIPLYGGFSFTFWTEVNPANLYAFIRPEHFAFVTGTWSYNMVTGSISPKVLIGKGDNDQATAEPARTKFALETSGSYRLWARTRDYSTNQPGTRFFQVAVDGSNLGKVLGQHGKEGFVWEDAGTLELQAGEHTLELVDTSSFYPRFDGIVLTNDLDFVPPETAPELLRFDTVDRKLKENLRYPEWARAGTEPARTTAIDNGKVRVAFHEVQTANGPVIQKETFLRSGDGLVKTDQRTDPFAYLLLYNPVQPTKAFDITDNKYLDYNSLSGIQSWMIPTAMEVVDGRTVRVTAENDYALLEADWSLPEAGDDPVVTLRLSAKKAGAFSLGTFHAPEKPLNDIDFLLLPFQHVSKRLPPEFTLVTEHYASTPLSLVTMPASGSLGQTSYGIAVDPSSIPNRWAYRDNSRFGLSIRGLDGGVRPGLFAPNFGSLESALSAGDTYEFRYRPITRQGGWFDAYKHVVGDVLGVTDYRKNVHASMTDAIFNMQRLVMDDVYGGWDNTAKGHYNMEGRNAVSQGSPLTQIQSYLLTEDPEIYEKRTIPTLEAMLTRGGLHFSATGPHGGYLDFKDKLPPVGSPINGFGSTAFGGAYSMTRDQVPLLRQIGIDGGVRHQNVYGNIPLWHEYLALYRHTGNPQYLTEAKTGADEYIAKTLTTPQYQVPPTDTFINITYAPYWQGLLDLYEATNEAKYLNAAEEGARWLMTSVWTQPKIPEGSITVDPDDMTSVMNDSFNGYWRGNVRERLGYPGNLPLLQKETVPAWTVSRIGLGLEQKSTFGRSANIMLSTWAPDLIRLAQHTGNDFYEMYARNAMVGRFSNYPGYYLNQFMVHQMKENYPYEGPDNTSIYYHHIPAMLGLSVDFLVVQSHKWSGGRIDFPSVREQGYAYFTNRHYGFAPGKLFGENDMWLWLKPGLITLDHIQADWIAARKDGRFAAVLMNEDSSPIEFGVQLGEEVAGTSGYNGTATVYDAEGGQTEVPVEGGKLRVSIPAHSLVGIALDAPLVKAPAYADVLTERLSSSPTGGTVVETGPAPGFGKGVVLQIDPNSYYAYVYTQFMPDQIRKAVLEWRIGEGGWQQSENGTFPFEFTVPVRDVSQAFTYRVKVLDQNNSWISSQERVLKPLDGVAPVTSAHVATAAEGGGGTNGWFKSPATLTLNAVDRGSGVTQTVYRMDGGQWASYTLPFTVHEDGIHTVEFYSTDRAGNTETVQSASVRMDAAAPVLTVRADKTELWSPNHEMATVKMAVYSDDNLSGIVSVILTSITSNEPDNGTGDGDQPLDIQDADFGTGDLEFRLRAERSGSGTGRIYTITYTAVDQAGNTATASAIVQVPHNM